MADPHGEEAVRTDPTGQDPAAVDPAANDRVKLQLAIFEVTREARGKSLGEIRELLLTAFARHGVKPPPNTWINSVASAAVYGEPYIIDFPSALAADRQVPAPKESVRRRLAIRRELRQEQLPPGLFPSAADWDIPDGANGAASAGSSTAAGTGLSRAVKESTAGLRGLVAAAALTAAATVTVLAVRAARRRAVRRGPGRHQPVQGTAAGR
jgi:hypothetical protein